MRFVDKLKNLMEGNNTRLCVGLDPDLTKIPHSLQSSEDPIFEFNKAVIDATKDLVCTYKPNLAFYAAHGIPGFISLKKTLEYIPSHIPIILDAKMNDIGNTAEMYARYVFEQMNADAVTLNPYMGYDSIEPFLKYSDKAVFVLCLTSNTGSCDFQYLQNKNTPVYVRVMEKLAEWQKTADTHIGAVIGATHPEEFQKLREISPEMIFLIPGVGTQGGELEKVARYSHLKNKLGIINVSRKIIFAGNNEKNFQDPIRHTAIEYRDMINQCL